MVGLYFDNNVHRDIVRGLRRRGVECVTSEEDNRDHLDDDELMTRSVELGYIMVSNDEDMLLIARHRLSNKLPFTGLIRIRQNAISVGDAIFHIELLVTVIPPEEWQYRIEFVPI